MRHKYQTRALVLGRTHTGEANTALALLTSDLGLVYARAQGLRRAGAKLAPALATFAESDVVLIRGKEGWRIGGAVLVESWTPRLRGAGVADYATRVVGLVIRLVAGDTRDPGLFELLHAFFSALPALPEGLRESAEIVTVLDLLVLLGLAPGDAKAEARLSPEALATIAGKRSEYVARINAGIDASGL